MALGKTLFWAVIAPLTVFGCAIAGQSPDASRITDVFIADFTSVEPRTCTTADVDLTHEEAHRFFQRASIVSKRQLADNYPVAPCKVEGTLMYSGAPCSFEISAAMTGAIRCEARVWHVTCETCTDLFE